MTENIDPIKNTNDVKAIEEMDNLKSPQIDLYTMLNRILAQDRKLDRLEMELTNYKLHNTANFNNLVMRHEKFEEHFEKTFDQLADSLAGIDKKLEVFIGSSRELDRFKQQTLSLVLKIGIPIGTLIAFLAHNYFTHR